MFNIVIALGLRQFYTGPVHTVQLHYIFYFDSENTTLEFSSISRNLIDTQSFQVFQIICNFPKESGAMKHNHYEYVQLNTFHLI